MCALVIFINLNTAVGVCEHLWPTSETNRTKKPCRSLCCAAIKSIRCYDNLVIRLPRSSGYANCNIKAGAVVLQAIYLGIGERDGFPSLFQLKPGQGICGKYEMKLESDQRYKIYPNSQNNNAYYTSAMYVIFNIHTLRNV